MTTAFADVVSVRRGATSIGLGGVIACGLRTCPNCGPRIAARNRAEITQLIDWWREVKGGTVLFGTFTVPHRLGQSFALLKSAIGPGWAAVTSGRRWVEERRIAGVAHWVRIFEVKWSPFTGWHLHVHYLMFIEPGMKPDALALLSSMFGRWARSAIALGFGAPSLAGQDLHEVTGENVEELLGSYLTKDADATSTRSAESLGFELTNADGKLSGDSYTLAEIRALAVAGNEQARLLWGEAERGMHGWRAIGWSHGSRAEADIGVELSEVAAAHLEGDELRRTVLEIRAHHAKRALAGRRRSELVHRAWDSPESAVEWLTSIGVDAVVGTFARERDREGTSADDAPRYEGKVPF